MVRPVTTAQGLKNARELTRVILAEGDETIPACVRTTLHPLVRQLHVLDQEIACSDRTIAAVTRDDEMARRLMTILPLPVRQFRRRRTLLEYADFLESHIERWTVTRQGFLVSGNQARLRPDKSRRKSAAPKKGSAQSKTASRRKVTSPAANAKRPTRYLKSKTEQVAAAKTRVKIDQPKVERVTKQERVLTLLSQSEGASIEEMMQATDWQQHSVRGFLAGTVKRKLGFSLTSLKPNDGVRRYRIETRRTR